MTNEMFTVKTGDTLINVSNSTEGLMDVVTTPMSELLGEAVLVAAHGYCFEGHGHTAYVNSQVQADSLMGQIHSCDCPECSEFRMQTEIRKRRAAIR